MVPFCTFSAIIGMFPSLALTPTLVVLSFITSWIVGQVRGARDFKRKLPRQNREISIWNFVAVPRVAHLLQAQRVALPNVSRDSRENPPDQVGYRRSPSDDHNAKERLAASRLWLLLYRRVFTSTKAYQSGWARRAPSAAGAQRASTDDRDVDGDRGRSTCHRR